LKLLPFFVFGFFCGIRPDGELEKLEWSSVHLVGKSEVEIPPSVSKTKRRRFVDLSENALAWLEEYRRGLIPEKWTVEKCSSAQVKGAEGNEEKSVQ
jgi:integrase